jgi:hypothetical protein
MTTSAETKLRAVDHADQALTMLERLDAERCAPAHETPFKCVV